ncbi:MAG: hypothetical protein A2W31_10075 [Planctomycetes bacterium RBG_16_64_10]|nr:MAG: hypothetical protein A2W31_10075 [Planctomycetes bacterium RBG_16_64_10]
MTSTSCILWTGLKKWIPTNCSGRWQDRAISVIEIVDVLEARMAPLRSRGSSAANTCLLTSMFSVTASSSRSA